MKPSTIGGINLLPEKEKRRIYCGLIPRELLEYFQLPQIESPEFDPFDSISMRARFQRCGNVAVP